MSSPNKRKRLNFGDKLQVINDYKNGRTLKEISIKFGIAKSSVCTIIKNKQKVIKNVHAGTMDRQSLKKGKHHKMERVLYKWFVSTREAHITLNNTILKEKAIEIQKKLNPEETFLASNGWLCKFKKRFGIRLLKPTGEKNLDGIMKNNDLSGDAGETGVYWKMLAEQNLDYSDDESAPEKTICTERSGSNEPCSYRNKLVPTDFCKTTWMSNATDSDSEISNTDDPIFASENLSKTAFDIDIVKNELEDDTSVEEVPVSRIKHQDAIYHFGKCIKWAEENNQEQTSILILKMLQQKAYEKDTCKNKED